jgi:choline transport protein
MLASLYHPNYTWTQWQVWLLYTLITIISCALIVSFPRWIPTAEKVFMYSSLLGFLVAFITVLATSQDKQPARIVFTDWVNVTGWPNGLSFLLATGQAMYGFLGMDGATHISEELPNPERTVPRVLVIIMAIGTSTSIPWTIALMFSTKDLDAVAASSLPIFEVFQQALNSQDAATFFTVWICFIYYGAMVSCFITAGRLMWAFSRDNGLPYSHIFAEIHPTLQAPVNATILAGAFMVLFGLLYVASTTAYNSFVSLAILATNLTCVIPQAIVLVRGRRTLPKRSFDLGAVGGTFCYAFSTLYASLYMVLFCFPLVIPVAGDSMNYLSAVLAGAFLLIVSLWWGGKRNTFRGPFIRCEINEGVEISAGDITRALAKSTQ